MYFFNAKKLMFLFVEGENVKGKFCGLGVSHPYGRILKRHYMAFLSKAFLSQAFLSKILHYKGLLSLASSMG